MQATFHTRAGLYRRDGRLRLPFAAAHLWPFSRAFVATLDLAGIGQGLLPGFDATAAIAEQLRALERYWDTGRGIAAYSSDVVGTRTGGDRYYDDNAWVGLALVQLQRMRPDSRWLSRAAQLFSFAVGGWDGRYAPDAGGVFWVEQGVGIGARNHDRNTVSTAPNAELALHLVELGGVADAQDARARAVQMYEWVLANLDQSRHSDSPGTGLFWDKVRGDGTLDRKLWSYNQGSMVGLNVLLARRSDGQRRRYLDRASAIARKALRQFAADGLQRQPAAFNAIFFRNLLLLHSATDDTELQAQISTAMRDYTDRVWATARDRKDRFHLSDGVTLLNQSAMVQLLALLAWDPRAYGRLA